MSNVPAHLIEETVGLRHTVKLMFVLFQKVHVALLWDKLQQLKEKQGKHIFICLFVSPLKTVEGFVLLKQCFIH